MYRLYLQANEVSRNWETLKQAIQLYEECVSMDPLYAPAWARLGRVRWLWDKYHLGSIEGMQAADQAFQKAFELGRICRSRTTCTRTSRSIKAARSTPCSAFCNARPEA